MAASALLFVLPLVHSPGLLVADTKLDLAVDPRTLLQRAWTMWDAFGAFGQVGNQAYGYFWPMGPFFLVGDSLHMPMWVVQRLWMGLVLVVAFQGAVRLARALGVRSDLAVLATGFAYALSPRMLTVLGPISIEGWPSSLAPWVLLCLIHGTRSDQPRRFALGAALATAMVGGVNAAATFAVVPLGALWLLTRGAGRSRHALLVWWPIFTLGACLWWLVPLFLLGHYSPPFLDYIETADVTTYPTTLFNAMRGTSDWIPYIEGRWRAGNDLIRDPVAILNSTVLIVLGLLGIVRRDNPHRAFLTLALLLGVAMVTAGHLQGAGGWFGTQLHELLDGALAPLRNVHKFDPLVRLPLVLGMGHLLDSVIRSWSPTSVQRSFFATAERFGMVAIALVAVVGAAAPAFVGRLMPAASFVDVPSYWHQAADWLGEHGRGDRTLLLPASTFGTYVWGDTRDEPLQALAQAPWAVRNAIPLAPPGNIRALDVVEQRLSRGEGSPGLSAYLSRLGVTYVLVRNDLAQRSGATDPVVVHQALDESPGIRRIKTFGPTVGGEPFVSRRGARLVVNSGWQTRYPALELFAVTPRPTMAVTAATRPVVVGAPEDLLSLADSEVVDTQPTLLAKDAAATLPGGSPLVLTDGLRLRDRFFGQVVDGESETLTAREARRLGQDRRDFRLPGDSRWWTRAVLRGAADVSASSSVSSARNPGGAQPAHLPYAAIDGDPETYWASAAAPARRAVWRVRFDHPIPARTAVLTAGAVPHSTMEVRVRTSTGSTSPQFIEPGLPARVRLPGGSIRWLTVEAVSETEQISLADVTVPGVHATRWLAPPAVPTPWGSPDVISFDARADVRNGCATVDGAVHCRADLDPLGGEEASGMRRLVTLPEPATYRTALQAVPRGGAAMAEMLQEGLPVHVSGSSTADPNAAVASGLAAVDGDPLTTWIADVEDDDPALDINWLGRRKITSVQLSLDPGTAAERPSRVRVSWKGGSQDVDLDSTGFAALQPIVTNGITLAVTRTRPARNITPQGVVEKVGAGISEVRLGGLPFLPVQVSDSLRDFGCGSGPSLRIGGSTPLRTAVSARPRDLFLGAKVWLRVCGGTNVTLRKGVNELVLGATDRFSPASAVLTRTDVHVPLATGAKPASPLGARTYSTDSSGTVIALRQNANEGWTARSSGRRLEPTVVDGWQQGFELSAPTTAVSVRYEPETAYRTGLVAGGVLLLVEVLLWCAMLRRGKAPGSHDIPQARLVPFLAGLGSLLTAGVVAGTPGFLAAGAMGLLLLTLVRRPAARLVVGLAPLALVGGWYALQPWGSDQGWAGSHAAAQWLATSSLGLLAATNVPYSFFPGRRRIAGASTAK